MISDLCAGELTGVGGHWRLFATSRQLRCSIGS
jgi:hypothetical protein